MNEYTALALWSTVPALMIATTYFLATWVIYRKAGKAFVAAADKTRQARIEEDLRCALIRQNCQQAMLENVMLGYATQLAAQQKQAREAQKAIERYNRQRDEWLKFTASIQQATDA